MYIIECLLDISAYDCWSLWNIISQKGEDFDKAVSLTAQALCELKSAHAISGLMAWCEQVSGQKYSWMNGTVTKAKGW